MELARASQLKGKHALALVLLADLQRVQGNYRVSLENLVYAREVLGQNPATDKDVSARLHIIVCSLKDQKGIILASNRLGTIHTMLSEYEQAEKYWQSIR